MLSLLISSFEEQKALLDAQIKKFKAFAADPAHSNLLLADDKKKKKKRVVDPNQPK
jgi:hypothetical protein